jgi:hypothetical protein
MTANLDDRVVMQFRYQFDERPLLLRLAAFLQYSPEDLPVH